MSDTMVQFVILTGMSGAGKTLASRYFEDFGFFCVDNLPPALIPTFADLCMKSGGKVTRVALVVDVRGGEFFGELFHSLDQLRAAGACYRIVFLDADNDTLVNRFKETRRRHPLWREGMDLTECIEMERLRLAEIRERADKVINTSDHQPGELKDEITSTFLTAEENDLYIKVVSFGFKYGAPRDADLVFDCRFLRNPNYEPDLGHLNGQHKAVKKYVLENEDTQGYLKRLCDLMGYTVPLFVKEGKAYLTIAVGCTGGRHRSVVVATKLAESLADNGYRASVVHRDIDRGQRRSEE